MGFFHGGREIARLCLCSADGPYCGHLYLWLPQLPLFYTSISLLCDYEAGLTISFSDEIPVFSGNEISFRNFGKFRRISVNFSRIFLNFEFSNEIFRKIPNFFFPVTSENEIFRRISAKFRRNFKP